jgi:protease I
MGEVLTGRRVAVLVSDGFEQVELIEPCRALSDAGAQVDVVSPAGESVKGWNHGEWGSSFDVDVPLGAADPDYYDALLLPGGVMSPDHLRRLTSAQQFVRAFFESGKPVAAICHAPWTLIDAGVVAGRRVTSYHTLQTDLRNAGAEWSDEPVVVDDGLVTGRRPGDIPVFNEAMIEEFARGPHDESAPDRAILAPCGCMP